MYAVDRDQGEGLQALKAKSAHTAEVDGASPESILRFKETVGDTTIDLLLNIAGGTVSDSVRLEQVTDISNRCCRRECRR